MKLRPLKLKCIYVLNIKMSKRSWDIIMAAIGFVRDLKEMDGNNDTN